MPGIKCGNIIIFSISVKVLLLRKITMWNTYQQTYWIIWQETDEMWVATGLFPVYFMIHTYFSVHVETFIHHTLILYHLQPVISHRNVFFFLWNYIYPKLHLSWRHFTSIWFVKSLVKGFKWMPKIKMDVMECL